MSRIRLAVLMGGPSLAHKSSILSGRAVLNYLDSDRFDALPVTIDSKGRWPLEPEHLIDRIDLVFIAAHGEFGEHGKLQMFFDDLGIPYTGSSAIGSALSHNKPASYSIFRAHGLNVPDHAEVMEKGHWTGFVPPFGYPLIVKPSASSHSAGVTVVQDKDDFVPALRYAFRVSRRAIVQRFIAGREIVCPVIEEKWGPVALPPVAKIKNDSGAVIGFEPAHLNHNLTRAVEHIALSSHKAAHCSDISSTDIILGDDGRTYVIEIDSIPQMAGNEALPVSARIHGLNMSDITEKIIASALRRYGIAL